MATIELDIIKQRSEKLLPAEKLELIDYLRSSLSPEDRAKADDAASGDDPADDDLVAA